jgi:hypothetical protein
VAANSNDLKEIEFLKEKIRIQTSVIIDVDVSTQIFFIILKSQF